MNFNLLILMFFLVGCGVKNDPVAPKTSSVPSLMENYPDIQTDKPIEDISKGPKAKRRKK